MAVDTRPRKRWRVTARSPQRAGDDENETRTVKSTTRDKAAAAMLRYCGQFRREVGDVNDYEIVRVRCISK